MTIYFTAVNQTTANVSVGYRDVVGGLAVPLPYDGVLITTPNTVPTPQA
jgi:hypothetical protein